MIYKVKRIPFIYQEMVLKNTSPDCTFCDAGKESYPAIFATTHRIQLSYICQQCLIDLEGMVKRHE